MLHSSIHKAGKRFHFNFRIHSDQITTIERVSRKRKNGSEVCLLSIPFVWRYFQQSSSNYNMWAFVPPLMLIASNEKVSWKILLSCFSDFKQNYISELNYRLSTCPLCTRRLLPRNAGPIFMEDADITSNSENHLFLALQFAF